MSNNIYALLQEKMDILSNNNELTPVLVNNPKFYPVSNIDGTLKKINSALLYKGIEEYTDINDTKMNVKGIYYKYLSETFKFGNKHKTRMEYDCNTCANTINHTNVVFIDNELNKHTLWDIATGDEKWDNVFKAMSDYIKSQPILSTYKVSPLHCEFGYTFNEEFTHMYLTVPNKYITDDVGRWRSTDESVYLKMVNFLATIKIDTFDKVDEVGVTNNQDLRNIDMLETIYKEYSKIDDKELWVWKNLKYFYDGAGSKSLASELVGVLVTAVIEDGVKGGVEKYKTLNNPLTRNVTSREIKEHEMYDLVKQLEKIGYDLENDFYGEVVSDTTEIMKYWIPSDIPTIESNKLSMAEKLIRSKATKRVDSEKIGISEFVEHLLPTIGKLEIAVDNLEDNKAVITKQVRNSNKPIFNHGNRYGFSYISGRTSSITDRVKNAGGYVDSPYRFSLSWDNQDNIVDLDLAVMHDTEYKRNVPTVIMSTNDFVDTVCFNKRYFRSMTLDIDANSNGYKDMEKPIENVYIDILQDGYYTAVVHNYTGGTQHKFEFLIKVDGEEKTYPYNYPIKDKQVVTMCTWEVKDGVVNTLLNPKLTQLGGDVIINNPTFKEVDSIILSPNYWNGEFGNAHYMFDVDGVKWNDKPIRFLHNELLSHDLYSTRRLLNTLHDYMDDVEYPYAIRPKDTDNIYYGFDTNIRKDVLVRTTDRQGVIKTYTIVIGE